MIRNSPRKMTRLCVSVDNLPELYRRVIVIARAPEECCFENGASLVRDYFVFPLAASCID